MTRRSASSERETKPRTYTPKNHRYSIPPARAATGMYSRRSPLPGPIPIRNSAAPAMAQKSASASSDTASAPERVLITRSTS